MKYKRYEHTKIEYGNKLSPRELDVIRMRFGLAPYKEKMTLEGVGKEFGVTRERIRQIQDKALEKLKSEDPEDILSKI